MTKKRGGAIVVVLIIAALIVGAFVFVAYRNPKTVEDTPEISELDELLNKDIADNYPSTPREVLKLYNRYLLCLYGTDGEELTEDQVITLGTKMRDLYDQELLDANTEDENLTNLTQELATFRADSKDMIKANVSDSNDVEYIDIDDASGAIVDASYFIRTGSKDFSRTYQQYLLRKDEQGNWKILSFVKTDNGGES